MKIEELAYRTDVSVVTINRYYRWARCNPDDELVKLLPKYEIRGNLATRFWSEDAPEKLLEFKKRVKKGRGGFLNNNIKEGNNGRSRHQKGS